MPRSASARATPDAASSPNALPPHSTTAWTRSISVPGRHRSVSRVPGAAPRTATPATAPARHSTTVQPVSASRSDQWPTSMPATSVMASCMQGRTVNGARTRLAAGPAPLAHCSATWAAGSTAPPPHPAPRCRAPATPTPIRSPGDLARRSAGLVQRNASRPRKGLRAERPSVLEIGGRRIGGEHFALIAGPCTVETRDQLLTTAHVVRQAGATMLRGGAYKPRTSPYAFQGLGVEGLHLLAEAKAQTGLPIVTELMDARDLEPVLAVADVIQIGARNMQNYALLAEVGRSNTPVLIKRGLSSTLDELLMAAEYVLKEGNPNVMLCERGIRTFETAYRFTLDLTAIPVLKELSHLPVIVDPSHAPGRRSLVEPLSLAAAAAGADGIIVEVHPAPEEAICDGPQQLRTEGFAEYAQKVEAAAAVAGKVAFLAAAAA